MLNQFVHLIAPEGDGYEPHQMISDCHGANDDVSITSHPFERQDDGDDKDVHEDCSSTNGHQCYVHNFGLAIIADGHSSSIGAVVHGCIGSNDGSVHSHF